MNAGARAPEYVEERTETHYDDSTPRTTPSMRTILVNRALNITYCEFHDPPCTTSRKDMGKPKTLPRTVRRRRGCRRKIVEALKAFCRFAFMDCA